MASERTRLGSNYPPAPPPVRAGRPRRSALYVPGSHSRALEKAKTLAADVLLFDLEDAVSPDAKVKARETVAALLAEGGFGERELVVRINGLSTEWGSADLDMVARSRADALLLPKVERASDVVEVDRRLDRAGAHAELTLWCMMETPRGILRAHEIASASPRLEAFVLGTSDLTKDLHAVHTRLRLPLLTSLGLCMLAARAEGLAILDGVHLELDADDAFAEVCRQGAELGFDGKTLIHPKQIGQANAAFAPSPTDLAWARRVIDAHAQAEAEGQGVVLVDGRLVESLHVLEARRCLELAEAIARRELEESGQGTA